MKVDIKRTLQSYGVTQQAIVDVLGISRQTFNYHINRGSNIDVATLQKIADIVGCRVEDFFYEDDDTQITSFKCPHCGERIKINIMKPTE